MEENEKDENYVFMFQYKIRICDLFPGHSIDFK